MTILCNNAVRGLRWTDVRQVADQGGRPKQSVVAQVGILPTPTARIQNFVIAVM